MTRIIIEPNGRIIIDTNATADDEPHRVVDLPVADDGLPHPAGFPAVLYNTVVHERCRECRGTARDLSKYEGDIETLLKMEGPALARALEPLPICKACKLDPGYSGRVQMPTLEEPPTEVSPIGNP